MLRFVANVSGIRGAATHGGYADREGLWQPRLGPFVLLMLQVVQDLDGATGWWLGNDELWRSLFAQDSSEWMRLEATVFVPSGGVLPRRCRPWKRRHAAFGALLAEAMQAAVAESLH